MKVLLLAFAALAAAGCAGHPAHVYPMLPPPGDEERSLTCEQLDDDILRSDAVRWSMRGEGMKVRTDATNASWLLANIPLMVVGGAPVSIPDLARQAHLSAADARIAGLLEIKSSKSCLARATADPRVTDLDVLHQLQVSEADWKVGKISEKTAIVNRTRLLDGLCDPQAIRASRGKAGLQKP